MDLDMFKKLITFENGKYDLFGYVFWLLVRFEPTLDQNTAYRHILISDGDRKATLRAEVVDASAHPDRFLFWRQVLCREPLAGSPYYWEVEWTGHKVITSAVQETSTRNTQVAMFQIHSLSKLIVDALHKEMDR